MKKLTTTALALVISVFSFAQVKLNSATTNVASLQKCNCTDLKATAYLYKEAGTTNYLLRLAYFDNKTTACTPVLRTLNIVRGGTPMIRIPFTSLDLVTSTKSLIIYRVKPSQLISVLNTTAAYVIRYAFDYGLIKLNSCATVNQPARLEEGEPIL
jgi:hypothetical protein